MFHVKQKPIAIDLFCGLGGWTAGLIAEGYDVIGFDIEQHVYGDHAYPAQLVVQDVLTLHGSQFRDAALIVASPPCQAYSWMAMPWKLAKAKAAAIRADTTGKALADLNRLFDACFRIQKEASIAAGRHIPMVVENVRGAQPWVGRARWGYGSFMLWGDVPALMPITMKSAKMPGHSMNIGVPKWNTHHADSCECIGITGQKVPGFRFDGSGKSFQTAAVDGLKVPSGEGRHTDIGNGARFTSRDCGLEKAAAVVGDAHTKGMGIGSISWHQGAGQRSLNDPSNFYSKSPQRKMASAMIAKIPLQLSRHIGRTFYPKN